MSGSHLYESVNISGSATAILGHKSGDVINIQQATFLLQATPTAQTTCGPSRVARHNQVLPDGQTTVETIKTYDEGDHFRQRGAVEQLELRWQRCEDIGVGTFGEVHREQTTQNGQVKSRAVKVLRRRHLKHMGVDHKKELDALIDLSQASFVHRFVEFHSWYESHDCIYLAMEYVPYGDLESHLQGGLNELDARQIAYQVLDGMRIMHDLDLSHRDIKPANIFVVQRDPVWWVKLGDFSICKRSMTRQTILRTQVGTQGYQAPEVLGVIDTDKKNMYDSKCDIWSFGCLIFEIITKQLPFPDIRTLNDYCNDQIPFPGLLIKNAGGSFLLAEFTWFMLQASPSARPTADQAMFLLSHRSEPKLGDEDSSEDFNFLYLKDCIGRHFKIPWQCCSRWLDMEFTLKTLLSYIQKNEISKRVSRGTYELWSSNGLRLSSHNWEQSASPGMRILVNMSPETRRDVLSDHSTLRSLDYASNQQLGSSSPSEHLEVTGKIPEGSSEAPARARTTQSQVHNALDVAADSAPTNIRNDRPAKDSSAETLNAYAADDPFSSLSNPPSPPEVQFSGALIPGTQLGTQTSLLSASSSQTIEEASSQIGQRDFILELPTEIPDELLDVARSKGISKYLSPSDYPAGDTASKRDTSRHVTVVDHSYIDTESVFHEDDHGSSTLLPLAGDSEIQSNRPTYMRVWKQHIFPETLNAYDLSWIYDPADGDYILIKHYVSHELTNELFRHTQQMSKKKGRTAVDGQTKEVATAPKAGNHINPVIMKSTDSLGQPDHSDRTVQAWKSLVPSQSKTRSVMVDEFLRDIATGLGANKQARVASKMSMNSLDLMNQSDRLVRAWRTLAPSQSEPSSARTDAYITEDTTALEADKQTHVVSEKSRDSSEGWDFVNNVRSRPKTPSAVATVDGYTPSRAKRLSVDLRLTTVDRNDTASNIQLVDWRGIVHNLPQYECRDWPSTRKTISKCFVDDAWHSIIKRGYYDIIEHITRSVYKAWEGKLNIKVLYGKTIEIVPWWDAWIFNLPPQVRVEQFTTTSDHKDVFPRLYGFPLWSAMSTDCIYFTTRSGYEYTIPMGIGQFWDTFSEYISHDAHGHERLGPSRDESVELLTMQSMSDDFDLYVLELKTTVTATTWQQWICPGMHIYELIHPKCSPIRAARVVMTADILLRRIEAQDTTQRPQAETATSRSGGYASRSPSPSQQHYKSPPPLGHSHPRRRKTRRAASIEPPIVSSGLGTAALAALYQHSKSEPRSKTEDHSTDVSDEEDDRIPRQRPPYV